MKHLSASNSQLSPKQVILDQKIAHSEQHILDLKTRRNTHAPISKLSLETLLRIFDILKDDEYNPFNHHLGRPFLTKHIIVHVCRQWRSLAFSAPALWKKPPLWDHDWALMYLKLSELELLDVKIFFTKAPLWKTVLKHMPRIKRLSIECYFDSMTKIQKFLRKNKRLDAPSLENLSFHSRDEMNSEPPSLRLLSDTFRQTNSLRRLELRNIIVEGDSPLLKQQLTTLELVETPLSARPTWIQLMDILRGLPYLEALKLSQACPVGDKVYAQEVVYLPNLRSLVIDGDTPAHIGSFLSQITFPQLRAISGGCFALEPETKDYEELLEPLLKLLPAGTTIGDAMTKMKLSDSQGRLTAERIYIKLESATSSCCPILNLHLPSIEKYADAPSVSSVIHSLQLFNLDFVGIYSRFGGVLDECFRDQHHLITIEIGHAEELPHLTEALEIPVDHPPNAPVPFPNLKIIELTRIHGLPWREKTVNKDDEDNEDSNEAEGNNHDDRDEVFSEDRDWDPWELPPKRTWTNFRKCLRRRAKYGIPVHELHVQKCSGLSIKWFDFFQEVVPVVKWDQNETL